MIKDWFPPDATAAEREQFERDFDAEFRRDMSFSGSEIPYQSRDFVFDGSHDDCPGQADSVAMMFRLWRRARTIGQ
ncbi:hypothetical protein MCB86_08720 [Pseudomonas sp. KSR10]|uniref:hypothetical protein n=1 Tax=Pseudomonas sp. KSR10 TaxID=2916654 RepID=UPI001EF98B8E|nr:hypothetical protein [Pseudomonas sp. KSR10]MCG6540157.1 hypothetical protein [Pseudomonas sp. KSR10]